MAESPRRKSLPSTLNRRELLAAGVAAGATLTIGRAPSPARSAANETRLDFAALAPGAGWPGWACPGVANLRRDASKGLLEAGTDVFPSDPRPVAFAIDFRFTEGEIAATIARAGAGTGVVLRRVAPRAYYAAIYDAEQGALVIVRRSPGGVTELTRALVGQAVTPLRLTLAASGASPTLLDARLENAAGLAIGASARDGTPELQRPGDPGVLATARTVFPSQGPEVLPALGNLHLLPYGVQEGEAFMQTPVGQTVVNEIRERSTGVFDEIVASTAERPRATAASAVAATTGAPVRGGAILRVASDLPATVQVEVSSDPGFRRRRTLPPQKTGEFEGAFARVGGLRPRRTVHWRARLRRNGVETVGPARSFKVLPGARDSRRARIAVGACAAQFGPIFDVLTESRPDVFVWQGDLNYPDTVGPLAQTLDGYAGIWRDFLANPRLDGLLSRASFAVQRDDHDYGVQDANSTDLVPWGLTPWEGLMERRQYYRFTAGAAEFWVLDQRRFKSSPTLPDTPDKTLLGAAQRDWLLRTLAASRAPFKVICSPCTLAPLPANSRDGSWAAGFTSERDLLLTHVSKQVSGTTLFITGDTHWTMVYDSGGLFEARPCPLCIPTPNDITLTDPQAAEHARRRPGVEYADDEKGHFALVDVGGDARTATLELTMVRQDGAKPYRRAFVQARP
ncbi:MAG: alkaline phosphatase D family protein [Gaiellaceae bacterium]